MARQGPVAVALAVTLTGLSATIAAAAETDSTPPDTVITAGIEDGASVSTNTTTSVTFAFEGTAGDTAKTQCSLDGSAFVDCVSPYEFTELHQGTHTVQFRAIDSAGNIDATPATRTFTVRASNIADERCYTPNPIDGKFRKRSNRVTAFSDVCAREPDRRFVLKVVKKQVKFLGSGKKVRLHKGKLTVEPGANPRIVTMKTSPYFSKVDYVLKAKIQGRWRTLDQTVVRPRR